MLFRVVRKSDSMYVPTNVYSAQYKVRKLYPEAEKIQIQHTERI